MKHSKAEATTGQATDKIFDKQEKIHSLIYILYILFVFQIVTYISMKIRENIQKKSLFSVFLHDISIEFLGSLQFADIHTQTQD